MISVLKPGISSKYALYGFSGKLILSKLENVNKIVTSKDTRRKIVSGMCGKEKGMKNPFV